MKKNFVLSVLLAASLLITTVSAAAVLQATPAPHFKVILDGAEQTFRDANGNKVDPIVIDGTTYLPLRAVANAFDRSVEWDEKTKTITISKGITVTPTGVQIGISMPTKAIQRWNQNGEGLKKGLEAAGYKVDLQYGGENEVPVQLAQIKNMIASGCKLLIIAPIDGESLDDVLAAAKAMGVAVIAYDRLIMGTDAVTRYVTFDNYKVGVLQGKYIEEKLGLKTKAGPFNIEFFTGDPGDSNIIFYYGGAMSVLKPYLDSGKLVCKSGQTERLAVLTEGWKTENAQARMENLITSNNYGPGKTRLDAVMCSNDSTAQGVTNALEDAGYTKDSFPIITGQDCNIVSVKNMIAGKQSMSVFRDTRVLVAKTVEMADAIMKGTTVPVNDTKTYDNGSGLVPSFLCDPVVVTTDNYREILIDQGYYNEEELR